MVKHVEGREISFMFLKKKHTEKIKLFKTLKKSFLFDAWIGWAYIVRK